MDKNIVLHNIGRNVSGLQIADLWWASEVEGRKQTLSRRGVRQPADSITATRSSLLRGTPGRKIGLWSRLCCGGVESVSSIVFI